MPASWLCSSVSPVLCMKRSPGARARNELVIVHAAAKDIALRRCSGNLVTRDERQQTAYLFGGETIPSGHLRIGDERLRSRQLAAHQKRRESEIAHVCG